jgi:hypothetical protein
MMATQRLTGTYKAGYTISAAYSLLKIAPTAEIDGSGLFGGNSAKIENNGLILAAAGAGGSAGQPRGHVGNTGIYLSGGAGGGRVVNFWTIAAGRGGAGFTYASGGSAGVGGNGGAAIVFSALGSVTNRTLVLGGDGGDGGDAHQGAGGDGGNGGGGVVLSAGGQVVSSGSLTGGAGGEGGDGSLGGGVGGEGGGGISLGAAGTVTTYSGVVVGGQGGAGGGGNQGGGAGGQGGAAITTSATSYLKNNALIQGGQGGLGGAGATQGAGGAGGVGGDGALLGGGGVILNSATIVGGSSISITGGKGGAGGAGGYGAGEAYRTYGGSGGAGGAGIDLASGGGVTNRSTISGGVGGGGGQGGSLNGAAAGGVGGAGIDVTGGVATLSNIATITGGQGGAGGAANAAKVVGGAYLTAGAGGVGGSGINLSVGGSQVNSGYIIGGRGGAGGAGSGFAAGGAGGEGGDGVDLRIGASIVNHGAITGGAGGAGGASQNAPAGAAGARGAGVVLAANCYLDNTSYGSIAGGVGVYVAGTAATVTNYGTISGGSYSVEFASSRDVLIAGSGAQFIGKIAGGGGTFDIVRGSGTISRLGGTGVISGTDSATFAGFGSYVISGTGWTLAGSNTLSSGQSLTDTGVLAVNGSVSEAAGATIAVGSGDSLTFSGGGDNLAGTISGAGTVTFVSVNDTINGAHLTAASIAIKTSTVTLEGSIVNTSALTVTTSTLAIGAGGATLSGGGTVALSDNGANRIVGLAAGDTLANIDNTISGAGSLGAGLMTLNNRAAGTVNGSGLRTLTIDTGVNQIANAGLIEATGAGGVVIQSAIANTGTLEANGGSLTVNAAVTGLGQAVIARGALVFNGTFQENVAFSGATGKLQLADSAHYSGSVSGFSLTGGTSLDLRDIAFVGSGEATFSGTASQGVLTVTDGTHTAHIALIGNYTASSFVASSDGQGGVSIVDPNTTQDALALSANARPPPHYFIAAMASLGVTAGYVVHSDGPSSVHSSMLSTPRATIA